MNYKCDIIRNPIELRSEIEPLYSDRANIFSGSVLEYFHYYGLNFNSDKVDHIFGSFESNSQKLVGHIFVPEFYKATIFVLHGYMNHCFQLSNLIQFLIGRKYAVAAFDMPGHGLSEGRRGVIEDFSQYTQSLCDFADLVMPYQKGPYHIIGFSNGASVVLDHLLTKQSSPFDKIIMIAPLIHFWAWEQSKIGYKFYKSFAQTVPRIVRDESSDLDYLDFVKNHDPLQIKMIPLKWVKALYDWNDRIEHLGSNKKSIKVIQGTQDTTVEWKFNIDFIRSKFSDVDVSLIENGKHELLNESTDIRSEVFSKINSYLQEE
jgi:alpha-beta hydrolase superfamily lysophospholipase